MKYILRNTNKHGEHWYFVAHGEPWPHRPELRLISCTTETRANARRFDEHQQALDAITLAGDPPGWEIDEVKE